jgi:cytochrome c biogenesis protein CcmG, thiol:disulfide interchange protein DsbE
MPSPAEKRAGSARVGRLGTAGRAVVVLVLGLFIALLVYGLSTKSPRTDIDEALARAEPVPAPDFELPVLERGALGPVLARRLRPALADGRVALDELRGTPVVLNFWASWCIPCREEAPVLERAWRRARTQAVAFVGVNMQDLTDDARAFIREFDNSYLNVRDQSNGVARDWGVTGIPETFFITARGRVVGHVIGVVSAEQLRRGIESSRRGRALGLLSGGEQLPTRQAD